MSKAMKRIKTKYPGVFYREVQRIGGAGIERMFYILFKKEGRLFEEKIGRQFSDGMTEAKAARVRSMRIEGKRHSRKEMRAEAKVKKSLEESRWTVDRLWSEYQSAHPGYRSYASDVGRYRSYLQPLFGDKEPSGILLLDVDRLRINLLKK